MRTIALLGGTFDPIHNGHIQSALELKQRLSLDELRLLPCYKPPHREVPGANSQQRLAMVKLAVAGTDLLVDEQEFKRESYSYSVDTLEQLRHQLGGQVSLLWVMGVDAFAHFDSWYRWQDFLGLAHIVIIDRPGESLPAEGPIAELIAAHRAASAAQLHTQPAGLLWFESLTPYPISATAIRRAIANKPLIEPLLPAAVLNYIQDHRLYAD